MELRAALGAYDPAAGHFTVYTSAGDGVIRQRDDIAGALGVAKDAVRVISGDVGGNFWHPQQHLSGVCAGRLGGQTRRGLS